MFDFLFGWRKASTCKKLIKRIQCRLKLLKNKKCVIARQFREDIAQLWKNGYQHIAFNRVDELHMDEDMIQVYELLEQFSQLILLNLSYIRRHKNLSDDLNEAVSTLIFASARCSDLPELQLLRKLFRKRYGRKLITSAIELLPGNFVNFQVKDKLTLQSVSEKEKYRLLDEIVGDCFIKPELLAQVTDHKSIKGKCSTSDSIALQSSPSTSTIETPNQEKAKKIEESSTQNDEYPDSDAIEVIINQEKSETVECTSESSTEQQYSDHDSVIYLDDVQEFISPTKQGDDKDQRYFMFNSSIFDDKDREETARRRITRRNESRESRVIYYEQCETDYSSKSYSPRKYQLYNDRDKSSLDQPFSFTTNVGDYQVQVVIDEEISQEMSSSPDYTSSPALRKCRALAHFARPEIVPEEWFSRAHSTTEEKVHKKIIGSNKNSVSPPYVHPNLPDYDEIVAKFTALKKIHQQNKLLKSLNMRTSFAYSKFS